MMASLNGNIVRVTDPLCGEFTDHRWIPRTKASDTEFWCFCLICAWINGWVNNREAGYLRRHRIQYDAIVMEKTWLFPWIFQVAICVFNAATTVVSFKWWLFALLLFYLWESSEFTLVRQSLIYHILDVFITCSCWKYKEKCSALTCVRDSIGGFLSQRASNAENFQCYDVVMTVWNVSKRIGVYFKWVWDKDQLLMDKDYSTTRRWRNIYHHI